MSLIALAFPELKQVDYNFIQTIRKQNDELYLGLYKPHFPVTFPVNSLSVEEFKEEVANRISNVNKFEFTIRLAVHKKDPFENFYHVYLIPDKGYSNLSKIYNRLYSGKLSPELQLDVDFVPHIGVGNNADRMKCKELADKLNKDYLCIRGKVNSIDLVQVENNTVTPIERIKLR